jgi:hypothetical protein
MTILLAVACCYFALNFLCALLLHLHGMRQAHPRLRFLDVVMHFLLLTVMGIPVLLVTSAEALFGKGPSTGRAAYQAAHPGR